MAGGNRGGGAHRDRVAALCTECCSYQGAIGFHFLMSIPCSFALRLHSSLWYFVSYLLLTLLRLLECQLHMPLHHSNPILRTRVSYTKRVCPPLSRALCMSCVLVCACAPCMCMLCTCAYALCPPACVLCAAPLHVTCMQYFHIRAHDTLRSCLLILISPHDHAMHMPHQSRSKNFQLTRCCKFPVSP